MTHFRFRYYRVGYMRWRFRAASCRALVLLFPVAGGGRFAPSMAVWRRALPVALPPVAVSPTLQVGDFVVSAEGDPQLSGHPDIRY